jgi:hypothetical protein
VTFDDALSLIGDSIEPGVITGVGVHHLSYSNLRLLDECSERWRRNYVVRDLPFQKSFPMAVGSGIHRACERYHLSDSPESALHEGVQKFKKEMGHLTGPQEIDGTAAITRMLNCYSDKYEQKIVATEREHEFLLAHDLNLKVVIDIVEDDGIADIKSIARKRDEFTPDELQLFFGLLACHVEGKTLEKSQVRPLRRDVTGARTPIALEPFTIPATPEWIEAQAIETVRRISDAQARIKSDLWDSPEHEKKWMCQRCPAFENCGVLTPVYVGSRL